MFDNFQHVRGCSEFKDLLFTCIECKWSLRVKHFDVFNVTINELYLNLHSCSFYRKYMNGYASVNATASN